MLLLPTSCCYIAGGFVVKILIPMDDESTWRREARRGRTDRFSMNMTARRLDSCESKSMKLTSVFVEGKTWN